MLGPDGTLSFGNAAVEAGAATPPSNYTLQWFAFDNTADVRRDVGGPEQTSTLGGRAPAELRSAGDYVGVRISATHPQQPRWSSPATFTFRRAAGGWELVGAER